MKKIVKLHDKYFQKYLSDKKIAKIIENLAYDVALDLPKGEVPIFIGILNGSFMFAADFIRSYNGDCEVSFVKLASYQGTNSIGKVKHLVGINEDLKGRTVVILEDIIDTGNTLEEIFEIFREQQVKQLKIVTLFFKPDVFRKGLPID